MMTKPAALQGFNISEPLIRTLRILSVKAQLKLNGFTPAVDSKTSLHPSLSVLMPETVQFQLRSNRA